MIPLRGATEIASRLELAGADTILLVEPPAEFEAVVTDALADGQALRSVEGRSIRSVKDRFALVLVWQESRIGAQAVLATALKRLAPGGFLWIVTALRKVSGPKTPGLHRLDLVDLEKAFAKSGLVRDREVRLSAWHAAYRYAPKPGFGAG